MTQLCGLCGQPSLLLRIRWLNTCQFIQCAQVCVVWSQHLQHSRLQPHLEVRLLLSLAADVSQPHPWCYYPSCAPLWKSVFKQKRPERLALLTFGVNNVSWGWRWIIPPFLEHECLTYHLDRVDPLIRHQFSLAELWYLPCFSPLQPVHRGTTGGGFS